MSQKQHDENLDAPTPPGGPQRTDAPDGATTPGRPARDPGPGTERVTAPAGEGDLPPAPDHEGQEEEDRDLQEENAESALDQPSQ